MIIVTLNVKGVGGNSKFLALKRFLDSEKPDVLLIQETMVYLEKKKEMFVKLLPNWYFCGVDSLRIFGGLLTNWNP
jgi:exonuclease III